jgi:hypothetical protein
VGKARSGASLLDWESDHMTLPLSFCNFHLLPYAHRPAKPGSLLDLVQKVPYSLFSSPSTYRNFRWFYQSETKLLSDLISLVQDVLLA